MKRRTGVAAVLGFWVLMRCGIGMAQQDRPPLPGPALDIPVDVDGDGASTYDDRYIFNLWLQEGGSLENVLVLSSANVVGDEIIDVSGFFSGPKAALTDHSPLLWAESTNFTSGVLTPGSGSTSAAQGGGGGDPEAPHFTERIPPQNDDEDLDFSSNDARITPDGQFIVFSSVAELLGSAPPGVSQIYRAKRSTGAFMNLSLISRDWNGNPAAEDCYRPSVSDDGNVVVFETTAVLAQNEPVQSPAKLDIYARIVDQGITRLLSFNKAAEEAANDHSFGPCVSGNGQVCVFYSPATNLWPFDSNLLTDVFRVRTDGDDDFPVVVSLNNQGEQSFFANFSTSKSIFVGGTGQALDFTGDKIIFQGNPCDWPPELCCSPDCSLSQTSQVYVHDFQTTLTRRVSRAFKNNIGDFVAGDDSSTRGSISRNGTRIAFASVARNFRFDSELDPDFARDIFFMYFADLLNTTVNPERVSVPIDGQTIDGHSDAPMLSTTGDRIGFESDATVLVEGDTNFRFDIFVRDVNATTPVTRRFSVTSSGQQATNGDSRNPGMTGDGRIAVYESAATNLNPGGDGNGLIDVYQTLSPLEQSFIRGDTDGSGGSLVLTDGIRICQFLFSGGEMACLDAGDSNDSGTINITDCNYVLLFLFSMGPPPPAPFPTCGTDPTGDGLTCLDSGSCQ